MTYCCIQDQRQSRKHSHHGIFSQDGMVFGAGEILKTVKGVFGRTVAYSLHSPSCIMLVSLRPHTYIREFEIGQIYVQIPDSRVAVPVRLDEDLCGKLGECSLGAPRSVPHHLDERYGLLYRGNATREFAT